MSKKKKQTKAPELVAIRPMEGPSVASLACSFEEAAQRVALGWQPMGTLADSVILVADAQALAAWQDRAIHEAESEEVTSAEETFEQAPAED